MPGPSYVQALLSSGFFVSVSSPLGPVAVSSASQIGALVAPLVTVITAGRTKNELHLAFEPPQLTMTERHDTTAPIRIQMTLARGAALSSHLGAREALSQQPARPQYLESRVPTIGVTANRSGHDSAQPEARPWPRPPPRVAPAAPRRARRPVRLAAPAAPRLAGFMRSLTGK